MDDGKPIMAEIAGAHRKGGVLPPNTMAQALISSLVLLTAYFASIAHPPRPILVVYALWPIAAIIALLAAPHRFTVWNNQIGGTLLGTYLHTKELPPSSVGPGRPIALFAPLAMTLVLLFEDRALNLLDLRRLALFALIGGGVLATLLAARRADFRRPLWSLGAVIVGAGVFAGVAAQADVLLDHAAGPPVRGRILGVVADSGRSGVYDHELVVWSHASGKVTSELSDRDLNQIRFYAPACVWIHPGALQLRWASAAPCPADFGPATSSDSSFGARPRRPSSTP